jgi:hypothetical protein
VTEVSKRVYTIALKTCSDCLTKDPSPLNFLTPLAVVDAYSPMILFLERLTDFLLISLSSIWLALSMSKVLPFPLHLRIAVTASGT